MLHQNAIILEVISLNGRLVKPHFLRYSDVDLSAAPRVKQSTMCPASRPLRSPETVQMPFLLTSPGCSQGFPKDPVPVSLLCHIQVRDVLDGTTTSQAAQGCQTLTSTSPCTQPAKLQQPLGTVAAAGRRCSPQKRLTDTAGHRFAAGAWQLSAHTLDPQQPGHVTAYL